MTSPASLLFSYLMKDLTCPHLNTPLKVIHPEYVDFQGRVQTGEMVVHEAMAAATLAALAECKAHGFRIAAMQPAEKFDNDDDQSMAANNSVAYMYRHVAGRKTLSHHALGLALDLNPMQNPYIRTDLHAPKGSVYELGAMGTITPEVAAIWKKHGFNWGGDWHSCKDYMHFSWGQSDVASNGQLTPEVPSK